MFQCIESRTMHSLIFKFYEDGALIYKILVNGNIIIITFSATLTISQEEYITLTIHNKLQGQRLQCSIIPFWKSHMIELCLYSEQKNNVFTFGSDSYSALSMWFETIGQENINPNTENKIINTQIELIELIEQVIDLEYKNISIVSRSTEVILEIIISNIENSRYYISNTVVHDINQCDFYRDLIVEKLIEKLFNLSNINVFGYLDLFFKNNSQFTIKIHN